ncbi:MAG: GNAT family N-acetyltransferase [Bacteroidales bacterium]|jgi:ribosomal-protein-alanine N-acetyltransferase|nr:GNAT family N-acetyltransferase [Bacteroidales bacterium]
MTITIKNIEEGNSKIINDLVSILNNDNILAKTLGESTKSISTDEFISFNTDWAKKNKATLFSILLDNQAIGLISLSKIDPVESSAKIGYWIGSQYWNKGYSTAAFKQVLEFARSKQIKIVSSSIEKNNIASLSIWYKFGAIIEDKGDRLVPILRLGHDI